MKPSFSIEAGVFGEEALRIIELAGRTCYKSEPRGDPAGFVRGIVKRGHESVIEHVSLTIRFIMDKAVTHELVRHRLASFSQESSRYVDYTREDKTGGHCQFIIPPWCNLEPGVYTIAERIIKELDGSVFGSTQFQRDGEWVEFSDFVPDEQWLAAMANAEQSYQILRKSGWTPQQARSVLPNSTKTEIVMTANLREIRLILKLRTAKAAHPQMREIMIPLLAELKNRIPVLFEDINPEEG
jgi:thymidylate synthase (FAD)